MFLCFLSGVVFVENCGVPSVSRFVLYNHTSFHQGLRVQGMVLRTPKKISAGVTFRGSSESSASWKL